MKKYITGFIAGFLIATAFVWAAAPTRQEVYTSGDLITAADITDNEDAIFNYLTAGVEVIKDNTILNADISTSANIQAGKLNLTAISQNIANTGTFTNTGAVTSTGQLTGTGVIVSVELQSSAMVSSSYTNGEAALCVDHGGRIFARDGGCN